MGKEFTFDENHASFLRHLTEICQAAQEQGIVLRGLGAVAVISHCQGHLVHLSRMGRHLTDLDVIGLGSQAEKMEQFFQTLGFEVLGGRGVTVGIWNERRIFTDPSGKRPDVDVFFDKLDFCHPIDFRQRLTKDFPTVSLADLMLEKLQIVQINAKDLKDLIVLLLEHDFADADEPEKINLAYMTRLLAQDWGFYYTVSLNLEKALNLSRQWDLDPAERETIRSRVETLRRRLEAEPKSLKWKLRAKIGPRVQWYQDVGEGYRDVPQGRAEGGAQE